MSQTAAADDDDAGDDDDADAAAGDDDDDVDSAAAAIDKTTCFFPLPSSPARLVAWMASVRISLMKLLCLRATSATGEPSRGRVITTRDHNREWTKLWSTHD